MATGFGVMMIGPAGSGKVSMTLLFNFYVYIVNFMSRIVRNW